MRSRTIFLSENRGNRCLLDAGGDFSEYLSWINDQETTQYMNSVKFPLCADGLKEYVRRQYERKNVFLGIFTKEENRHVGNINLHMIDQQNRTGEVGIMIGEKNGGKKGMVRRPWDSKVDPMSRPIFMKFKLPKYS